MRSDGVADDLLVSPFAHLFGGLAQDPQRNDVADLLGDDVVDVRAGAGDEVVADAGEVAPSQADVDGPDADEPEEAELPERDDAEEVVPVEDRIEEPLGVGLAPHRQVPARVELDGEDQEEGQVDQPEVVGQLAAEIEGPVVVDLKVTPRLQVEAL